MKKYISLVVLAIVSFTISTLAADDQIHSIQVNSISISTSRSQIGNNFGSFSMNATDETGSDFNRNAVYGYFSSGFTYCDPCSKGSSFSDFASIGWLTGGSAQHYNEWAKLSDLQISAPVWTLPIQQPRNRPLVKYIPVTITGKITVEDNRPQTYKIFNIDNNVRLTGIMRVEFRQERYFPTKYTWLNVQITATRTP